MTSSVNSSGEDDYDEAVTNALFSVQGNVDEVSVINAAKPYPQSLLNNKRARATPNEEPARGLESLT